MGDEKEARHLLADMQARLARSAYDALGIQGGAAGPAEARAAFLQLTKTFHPQKFARMSSDIQRMATEVFLGLRAAHDQLARPKNTNRQGSGAYPALAKPTEASRSASSSTTLPRQASTPPARPTPVNLPNQPPPPSSAINPGTVRGVPPASGVSQQIPRVGQTAQARPPANASHPPRRVTPVGGVPIPPSGPRPVVGAKPATPATAGAKQAGATNEPELVGVYDLLQRGEWEAARTTLNALIALQPRPRYRALLQYSLGREAQLARRLDEARVDLQAALEIDPELQLAKTALAELFTRRR